MDKTIGFELGTGYCIHCGKAISYNEFHPELFCLECDKLDTKRVSNFCHKCGSDEVTTEGIFAKCRNCDEFRGFKMKGD